MGDNSLIPGFVFGPIVTMGETVDELMLIWGAAEPSEYYDLLHYLPLKR